MSHFLRVAAVTPKLELGQPLVNAGITLKVLQELAGKKVHVALFPELNLTGYTCQDLFHDAALLKNTLEGLAAIIEKADPATVGIVGVPLRHNSRLYNCAVVFQGRNILGVVPKTYLPNYNEFYEQRWFSGAKDNTSKSINLFGREVPFGTDLVFELALDAITKATFGIEICEDLWAVNPPSNNLALNGATVIFNLSASNELVGKADYRRELVRQQSGRLISAYVYTSAGAGESASDTVFSGHAIIAENDRILQENNRFDFGTQYIVSDISLTELETERIRNTTFGESSAPEYRKVSFNAHHSLTVSKFIEAKGAETLNRKINPFPFIPSDDSVKAKVCEEIIAIQSTGLQRKLRAVHGSKIIIGVSGGLDSTQALLVAVDAMDKMGRPRTDIIGVTLPGMGTTSRTKSNAWILMEKLGIDAREIDIKPAVLQHFKDIGQPVDKFDITFENAQARERTQILFDLGNKENALLIGTGDLSEAFLGWCTMAGDQISAYHVNSGIPKTLIKYLIAHFATTPRFASVSDCLKSVYETVVSPELLPPDAAGNIAQSTEDSVGPYELHDFIMYYVLRKHISPTHIYLYLQQAWGHKYDNKTLHKWLKSAYSRFFRNQFKRNSAPDGIKVGSVSLSQRADWRTPSDLQDTAWLEEIELLRV